ncbi:MAG TPA: zinc-binding dehydrogenase [Syntrophobacteraceae bacterium]|nr:zinc-binding dehydrogenase [Syntrophobacteraceae bacterium]
MKALHFITHGGPEVLRYGDVPEPVPGPRQVRVRVRACAVNHLDVWVRRGWPGLDLSMPHWGGSDIAGVVDSVGSEVTQWRVGDRVVANPGWCPVEDEFTLRGEHSMSPQYRILGEQVPGGFAEYALVPAGNLAAMPDSLDFPEAAAPLVVTITAWRMLIHRAGLRAGESVLIVGAGGGVNTMAVQIARLAGATVYVVAGGPEKARKAEELGADYVIDRSLRDWDKEMLKLTRRRGVDVVVDNVGAATLPTSMKVAARGGRIVIVGNTSGPLAELDLRYIFSKQIQLIGSTLGNHQDFLEVLALLWKGKLRPVIDRVMPLSRGREALQRIEHGDPFGKIVLVP